MTTSGSSTFNPAVTQIVTNVLRHLGVLMEDEQPTGGQYTDVIYVMNTVVAAAQATGLHVWTEDEAILFLQPGQVRYEIGGPGTNANTSDANDWDRLTLTASAAAAATTITVDTIVGLSSGQNIGVILDSGITFWTTISGAPSGSTVTLASALPTAASSGNYALVYTTAIVRPLRVPNARLYYLNGGNEIPMVIMSRQEYMDQPNKLSPGSPTQWFYTPQRDRGILYIWPAPNLSFWAVRFTWYRPLQDFFSPGNTMDFPQEWIAPLTWATAKDCISMFDVPPERMQFIMNQAASYGDLATSYDRESEPIQFGMSWDSTIG